MCGLPTDRPVGIAIQRHDDAPWTYAPELTPCTHDLVRPSKLEDALVHLGLYGSFLADSPEPFAGFTSAPAPTAALAAFGFHRR